MKNLYIGCIIFFLLSCNNSYTTNKAAAADDGINHYPTYIHYTKHARCRMACRHINENEIKTAIAEGILNEQKSNLNTDDCHKRYAIEDNINGQRIRLIVAFCNKEATIITCIDLAHEWTCNCSGDEH
jgi:hypothetical protein